MEYGMRRRTPTPAMCIADEGAIIHNGESPMRAYDTDAIMYDWAFLSLQGLP